MGLRELLDQITASEHWTDQPRRIDELRTTYEHSIESFKDTAVDDIPIHTYNCFMYALGIACSNSVIAICDILRNETRIDGTFIESLISNYLKKTQRHDGGLLIYSNETGIVMHAGIIQGTRVVSKWGKGKLWIHRPLELPKQYGSTIRTYSRLDPDVIEQAFITYAKYREGASMIDEILL